MEHKGLILETYYTQKDLQYTFQCAMVYYDGKVIFNCTSLEALKTFLSITDIELHMSLEVRADGDGVANVYKLYKEFELETYNTFHALPDELSICEMIVDGTLYVGYLLAEDKKITIYYPDLTQDSINHKIVYQMSPDRKRLSSNVLFHIYK
ncbi:hypothetical protein ACQUY5_16580 [Bacillus cereus]|uniref:hypothetical protein n=1 Tax=Bacillus cereus TaxID=1396 RepID=UPI003D166FAF